MVNEYLSSQKSCWFHSVPSRASFLDGLGGVVVLDVAPLLALVDGVENSVRNSVGTALEDEDTGDESQKVSGRSLEEDVVNSGA